MTGRMKDGQVQRILYTENVKSDAYPVVQLAKEDQILKGFNWQPGLRPADRTAVTPLTPRPPERSEYLSHPRAAYRQTDIYFPGYIDDIYLQISLRDSLNHVRSIERQRAEQQEEIRRQQIQDSLAIARLDSLETVKADSLALQDSLKAVSDSLALADSIARADSIAAMNDPSIVLTKEQIREKKKAEKERRKQERIAAREARWAEMDKADAEKEKAKADRKAARIREKKRKALRQAQEQAVRDSEMLQRYIERYEKKMSKRKVREPDVPDSE